MINQYVQDMGLELSGSYEELFEEVDLPEKASETEITTLYKYQPVGENLIGSDGTTATQNVVNILEKCILYAATPVELNDPFEVTLPAGKSDLKKYRGFMNDIWKEFKWFTGGLKREDDWLNEKKERDPDLDLMQAAMLSRVEDYITKSTRILSLTSKNNDPLMWSHYGGGHKGVCLGFRVAEGNIFGEALEVQYKEPPIYYTLGDTSLGRMTEEAIMTKTAHWSYEKEWRVIVRNQRNPAATMSNLPFEPKWITEIIFGLHVNEKVKSTLVSAAGHMPGINIGDVIPAGNEITIKWRDDKQKEI